MKSELARIGNMKLTPANQLQIEVPFNASALFWTGVACIGLAAFIAAVSK